MRAQVIQRLVRALVVVPADPAGDRGASFGKIPEVVLPDALLFFEAAKEALDDPAPPQRKLITRNLAVMAVDNRGEMAPAVGATVDVGQVSMAQRWLLRCARLIRPCTRGRGVTER
jgi:hypothetical protein